MPECENAAHMNSDVFAMIDLKANNIRRQAEVLLPQFQLLGACHSYQTLPEGALRLAASRLRDAAEYLDGVAQEAADTRTEAFLEAAE